ncbi:MAG: hypothetical protein D6729_00870 [Deltaproteobacteria bacterium]|nr:MAG: hypothetical protein D6729_00870 [Deltaproteobacteria bacterium]
MIPSLMACAVCFGEPGSPMAKGAEAGVTVLGLVILATLLWVAFLIAFFVRRARRVARARAEARGVACSAAGEAEADVVVLEPRA